MGDFDLWINSIFKIYDEWDMVYFVKFIRREKIFWDIFYYFKSVFDVKIVCFFFLGMYWIILIWKVKIDKIKDCISFLELNIWIYLIGEGERER